MLARIKGLLIDIVSFKAVVDVHGLGFEVQLTKKAADRGKIGDDISLYCHLQFSDNGPTLFGFSDELEKAVFLRLTSVKGVGGKMALQVLQGISAEEIVQAISLGDSLSLTRIPGIGKKTAERICFELQEKMALNLPCSVEVDAHRSVVNSSTVLDALESLGFSRPKGADVLSQLSKERGSLEGLSLEELIMLALRRLNGPS